MKERKRILTLDKYEYGVIINALNNMRTALIEQSRPTDAVDEILIKTIYAPEKKMFGRNTNAEEN
jgi:hypothetical protein